VNVLSKRLDSKHKIDRRLGVNLWGRAKSPINRREYGPGQHGQRRKGKLSDYGVQLRAKQKLKGYYANMSERHFRGIYEEARRLKGDTGAHMIGLLERRLDTVIYRAKFVPTVFAARQFISHGHIKVNGKRVTVASFRVKVGDMIEVKEKSKQLALVLEANALAERDVPDYIEVDHSKMAAKLGRIPAFGEVPYPVMMEPHLVVEYYSR
jgi:small subunit ribosomal protein S4